VPRRRILFVKCCPLPLPLSLSLSLSALWNSLPSRRWPRARETAGSHPERDHSRLCRFLRMRRSRFQFRRLRRASARGRKRAVSRNNRVPLLRYVVISLRRTDRRALTRGDSQRRLRVSRERPARPLAKTRLSRARRRNRATPTT